jgi:hypothetical protein
MDCRPINLDRQIIPRTTTFTSIRLFSYFIERKSISLAHDDNDRRPISNITRPPSNLPFTFDTPRWGSASIQLCVLCGGRRKERNPGLPEPQVRLRWYSCAPGRHLSRSQPEAVCGGSGSVVQRRSSRWVWAIRSWTAIPEPVSALRSRGSWGWGE